MPTAEITQYARELAQRVSQNPRFADISHFEIERWATHFDVETDTPLEGDARDAVVDKLTWLLTGWARTAGGEGWRQLVTWALDNRTAVMPTTAQRPHVKRESLVANFGALVAMIEDGDDRAAVLISAINHFRHEYVADGHVEIAPSCSTEQVRAILADNPNMPEHLRALSLEQIAERLEVVSWGSLNPTFWRTAHGE